MFTNICFTEVFLHYISWWKVHGPVSWKETIQRFWDWIMAVETGVFVDPQEGSSKNDSMIIESDWLNLYCMIQFIPDVFEIFQSRISMVLSVDLPFPVPSRGQLLHLWFLPSFFLVARWFFSIPGQIPDWKRNDMRHALNHLKQRVFWFCVKLNCNLLNISKPIISLWWVSATCCMLENRHGSGGNRLGWSAPLLMDSQKFSCDVRDFTFGTGTPRVLRRIDASCHLAGSDQTKQLHWKVPWPSKGNGHSQYWIQVGGSAIDCESHANLVNSGARICSFKMLDVTMTIYDSWLFGSEFYHFLENLPYNCWHFFLEIGITTIN